MKKITLLIILLSAFNFGFGQEIASFSSLQNSLCSGVVSNDLNISATGICRGSGIAENVGGTYNSRGWTTAATLDANDYLEWTLTSNLGYQIDLSTIDLTYDRSGQGPTMVDLQINTGSGFSSVFTDASVSAGTEDNNGINLSAFTGITGTITFRLYAFNAGATGGTFDIDENIATNKGVVVNGIVTALPACSGITTTWSDITNTWNNGVPGSSDNVILNGNFTTVPGVNLVGCSLTVNAGYTLTVIDNTFVEIQNEVNVSGTIDVNPYGSFVQRNDAIVNSLAGGNVFVRKETAPMRASYEYTYWSSPLQNSRFDALSETDATRRFRYLGANFLDATQEINNDNTSSPGQDGIDDNGNDWAFVSGATIMQPGVGYAATLTEFAYSVVPGGPLKQITLSPFVGGSFNNGVYNVPVYRNDSELNDDNLNLIGNPYPSAIDVDLFLAENKYDAVLNPTGTLDGVIYLWSQNTAPSAIANGNQQLNFSDSDYAIINGSAPIAGGDGIFPTNRIPSGQAFFVTCSNDAPATLFSGVDVFTADVIFNNSMRTIGATDNSLFFKGSSSKKQSNSVDNKLWVNLTSDNGVFNQMAVAYVNGATDNNDGSFYDASKPASIVTGAILYSNIEGSNKKFGIQGKAVNSLDVDETISLGFKSNIGVATLFKLSIDHLQGDFLNDNTIYLKDNLLNKIHDLSASDYTFTTEVGEFNERFQIVFDAESALSTDEAILNTSKFSIVDLGQDNVQFNTNSNLNIKTISIFDLLGRQLYDLKGRTNSDTFTLSNLKHTIYIAKIELSNGVVITKKAIKK